jgi:isoleucyl-tRNA synthetase
LFDEGSKQPIFEIKTRIFVSKKIVSSLSFFKRHEMKKYPEYKKLDLAQISKDILAFWEQDKTFQKSISEREGKTPWVFYEGPPSANGLPGIHHVMARSIKDIFCRFKTLQGFQVKRKAGWDTHGLPIELSVEKSLGITKEDIGKKITVEEYNVACRKDVMKYTDKWENVTKQMGYWVDMQDPYITYDNKYIESVWWLLNNLFEKDLLYKGYTIQPYSPAAGTGLSSAELNQPGCYRNVKDRTAVVMFKTTDVRFDNVENTPTYFLAWTTTPWTLPSNTALAVGGEIEYTLIKTFNTYSGKPIRVIVAKELIGKHFNTKAQEIAFADYKAGDKLIPYEVIETYKGKDLVNIHYEQLLPFVKPDGEAFKVLVGDFVTTTDGTGIVHIAPSFGADDFKVAKQNGVSSLTLVDKRGRFSADVKDGVFLYGEEYVKEAYLSEPELKTEFEKQKQILEANGKIKELKVYLSVDERIVLKLQEEDKLFKKETYEHSYPHCWRTDKPVLYYPLDSWFVKVADNREKLVNLNQRINWKPESTGTGRFGEWLKNALDWNLSRSRFWGIPLPIWQSEDKTESTCIGSIEQLQKEIDNAITKGYMSENPLKAFKVGDMSVENYNTFDLHKPYADNIILEKNGKKLTRESDLIDVWFDSGAMPYAQIHYPFENKELIDQKSYYPADFIAEGVDQTRGWFYTLHVIGALCFDSIAYKNVVSNGLVLDKNGNKMSKRLGNAVDPFETIEKYGADATRWYMIANAAPWDNLKFDVEGISEVQRKLFGTLYNTYGFFSLYANVDGFVMNAALQVPVNERVELDRWILSKLQTLLEETTAFYEAFEPHRAARAIEDFVDEHLSNWYVRLSRRRFWKGEMSRDKQAAYETLFTCLSTVAQLMSPIAPFFADWLHQNLNGTSTSIHLTYLPKVDVKHQDKALEERMDMAQKVSSMVLSIRKTEKLKVRQPLQRIQIPVLDKSYQQKMELVKELILSEVNVKEIEFVNESQTQIVKQLKLNFKTLGKKCGKHMKAVQAFAGENANTIIKTIEKEGIYTLTIENEAISLENEDVEIIPVDIPGWKVANSGALTVALDVSISESLKEEGLARELVNRIQNIRKEKGLEVTDKISVKIQQNIHLDAAIKNNLSYICSETLTNDLQVVANLEQQANVNTIEVDELISTFITIKKLN